MVEQRAKPAPEHSQAERFRRELGRPIIKNKLFVFGTWAQSIQQ